VFRNIFSYKGPKAGSGIPPAVKKAKAFVAKKYGEATQGRPFTKTATKKTAPSAPPSRPKAPTKKSHNIVRGDTLSQIAEKYGTTVATLKKLNNIKDVNKIRAGSTLKLPDSAKKRTTKPVPTPKSRPQMYTLKSGKKGTYEQRMQEIKNEKLQKQIKKAIQTKKRAGKNGR
jgi:LysM repeat protein